MPVQVSCPFASEPPDWGQQAPVVGELLCLLSAMNSPMISHSCSVGPEVQDGHTAADHTADMQALLAAAGSTTGGRTMAPYTAVECTVRRRA